MSQLTLILIILLLIAICVAFHYIIWVNDIKKSEPDLLKSRQLLKQAEEKLNENAQKEAVLNKAISNCSAIPYMARFVADYQTYYIKKEYTALQLKSQCATTNEERNNLSNISLKIKELREITKKQLEQCKEAEYQLDYLLKLYPSLKRVLDTEYLFLQKDNCPELGSLIPSYNAQLTAQQLERLFFSLDPGNKLSYLKKAYKAKLEGEEASITRIVELREKQLHALEDAGSNLRSLPHMSSVVSEFVTLPIEEYARKLDWGNNKERTKKVASIRQIRAEAQALIERYKLAEYQLEYLKNLYPVLEDVLETEYSDLPKGELGELPSHDPTKDYLSKEEWDKLSVTERNQLALDRYIEGHRKTKWQIGRDYELYIGYVYERKGYTVDYFGSYMGMEDLGRDLIARKGDEVLVIQCKYWSSQKVIREKHITQLYGTMMCYCMEHNIAKEKVRAVFCTNISVSDKAKEFSEYLGVQLHDNIPLGNFPRIKCNVGKDENGAPTYIYHLPFDQQYDHAKIDSPGECFAMTVAEAESKGFRRAYKWFGEKP